MTNYIFTTSSTLNTSHVVVPTSGNDNIFILEGVALINDGTGATREVIDHDFTSAYVPPSYITNYGTLMSVSADTIFMRGDGTNIYNGATGKIVSMRFAAVHLRADDMKVTNLGEFVGNAGVMLYNGRGVTIDNSGTITATGDGANDAAIKTYITSAFAQAAIQINNSGTLNGAARLAENGGGTWAIWSYAFSSYYEDFDIANSGTINGSISLLGGMDLINNSGEIFGDVLTLAGEDTVLNQGTIAGDVDLGDDDDIYTAVGDGVVTGQVRGGLGNDTLTGGNNADYLDGGVGNDRLYGRGGDDDLRAGEGADFVAAGTGDDQVLGDDGADKIFGGAGDDTLQGGRDQDTIRGGDGNDEINGGRLADVLRGGAGADTFLYTFKQDSSTGASDTIQDFEVGIDVIDLSAVASGLTFVGTAAFSGTGNEVRYDIAGNGKTFIQVDTDANGSADMRIWLTDVGALSEDDFVL